MAYFGLVDDEYFRFQLQDYSSDHDLFFATQLFQI